jgi:hypothetical protein
MPVRFVVFQRFKQEEINIGFLKPTSFARLFNSKKMMNFAKSLEQDMNYVLEEIDF